MSILYGFISTVWVVRRLLSGRCVPLDQPVIKSLSIAIGYLRHLDYYTYDIPWGFVGATAASQRGL